MDIDKFTSVWDMAHMNLSELVSKPFEHIKARLFDYKTNPDSEDIKELRMLIQSYLREMNRNDKIPFSQRLTVIDALGSYIIILQEIGVPNLLESYDKVITPIIEKAENKPLFAEALVELSALSYHLIVADLQRTLFEYREISLVSIRRALSLMHAVLKIFRKHKLPSNPWLVRLTRLYVVHELLRLVNTYSMTTHAQKASILQLRKHMEAGTAVDLRFFFAGERIEFTGAVIMTDPQKPHAAPIRVLRFDAVAEQDMIVLCFDAMAQKALAEMRHAKKKISPQNQGEHGDYVMVADALNNAIALGEMVRNIMYTRPREHARDRPKNKKNIAIEASLDEGLHLLHQHQCYLNQSNFHQDKSITMPDVEKLWHVIDQSSGGFYVEKIPIKKRVESVFSTHQHEERYFPIEVGIVVAYALLKPNNQTLGNVSQAYLLDYGLAKVSWFRINNNDIKSIGLAKLMTGEIKRIKIIREMLSTTASNQFYSWVETVDDEHQKIWSTQEHLTIGTAIAIQSNNAATVKGKIVKMVERGVNYIIYLCKIIDSLNKKA